MRARARDEAGVAAECLLAARGFRLTSNDEATARAYTGALLEIEAFNDAKQSRQMLASIIKALNG